MNFTTFVASAVVVALLQTAALGAMVFQRARALEWGREIVVESGAVDPRDLFRGHYVTLDLVVGELKKGEVHTDRPFETGETVFVAMQEDTETGFWRATGLFHEIPAVAPDAYLKGRIALAPNGPNQEYRVRFPIDRYFADKNRAKDLEKIRQDQRLGVVLSVAADGNAYIKGLTLDGERIYDEPLL